MSAHETIPTGTTKNVIAEVCVGHFFSIASSPVLFSLYIDLKS